MLKNKIVLSFISASLLLTLLAPMSIYASSPTPAEDQPIIIVSQASKPSLFWNYADFCDAEVSSSGKTIKSSIYVEARTGTKISGTMYLEKSSGGKWVNVKSWSVSGTSHVVSTKDYTGSYGTTYRVRFSGTATYSGKSERVSATSVSIVL